MDRCIVNDQDCGGRYKGRGFCLKHYAKWQSKNMKPEYRAWSAMKNRCYNPHYFLYNHYGARGIKVCDRWLKFENFYADMGNRPTPTHSLDRKDNDGNYEPSNCRWATKLEQSNNRSNVYKITIGAETKSLKQWCIYLKLPYGTIHCRIKYLGWPANKALGLTNG